MYLSSYNTVIVYSKIHLLVAKIPLTSEMDVDTQEDRCGDSSLPTPTLTGYKLQQHIFNHCFRKRSILLCMRVKHQHGQIRNPIDILVQICHIIRQFLPIRVKLSKLIFKNLRQSTCCTLQRWKIVKRSTACSLVLLKQKDCVSIFGSTHVYLS